MNGNVKNKILITDLEEAKKHLTNEDLINKLMNTNTRNIIEKRNQRNYYGNSPIPTIYDKDYYKLNNEFSLFPSPEKKIKKQLKPIVFKSGVLKPNPEEFLPKPQYYVPIMQKNKSNGLINTPMDPLYYVNNSRYGKYSPKSLRLIKNHISLEKKTIETKKNENSKKELKDFREKIPMFRYFFNNTGKPVFKEIYFNTNNNIKCNTSEFIKYHSRKRRIHNLDFFQDQINRKRREYKDQLIQRSKYQHNRYYNIEKYLSNINQENNELKTKMRSAATECYDDSDEKNEVETKNAGEIISARYPNSKVSGYDKLYLNSSCKDYPKVTEQEKAKDNKDSNKVKEG